MKKKILIVDDDAVFTRILTDTLPAERYEIVSAGDGEAGLEALTREKPDLVLLDILMPKVSGIGFLKTVKEKKLVAPPILIFSNLDSMEEVSAALALGARGYIVKSEQDIATIVATIERTLENVAGR